MPQMSPLNWTILYSSFTMILMMFIVMNFFLISYKTEMSMKKKKSTKLSWKW